jgi:DNA-binding CsgD family transcriptional regulator
MSDTLISGAASEAFRQVTDEVRMEDPREHRLRPPLALLLVAIAVGATIDLVLDKPTNWLTFHTVYEGVLVVGTLAGAAWLWSGWRRAESEGSELRRALERRQTERDLWRAGAEPALAGFAGAVDQQFAVWRLTPAEREVALLLLKGHGHKEIARQSGRSERTVRQHAAAAYAKAGLDGRAALAAFFLEGLRLPAEEDGQPHGQRPADHAGA